MSAKSKGSGRGGVQPIIDSNFEFRFRSIIHRSQWCDRAVAKLKITVAKYRLGTVNSKSFVGKVLLRIKWKFELN